MPAIAYSVYPAGNVSTVSDHALVLNAPLQETLKGAQYRHVPLGWKGLSRQKLTVMRLIMPSAWLPRDARQMPKNREKVMMPRMFMLTAATTTLSGTMLRATASSA